MLTTAFAILGLFALRLGVPLAVALVLGEAFGRLNARWSGSHGVAA